MDESLRDIVNRANSVQHEVYKVLGEIRRVDKSVFDEIVRVTMTPGASFTPRTRTVDFLGGHTVHGQSMYDKDTRGIRRGFEELIAGCLELGEDGWELAESLDGTVSAHDVDDEHRLEPQEP